MHSTAVEIASSLHTIESLDTTISQSVSIHFTIPSNMENGTAPAQNEGRDPSGFLSEIIGNNVTVKLNSGVVYKGEERPPRHWTQFHLRVPDTDEILEQASCSLLMAI